MTDATPIDAPADPIQIAEVMRTQIEVLLADLRRKRGDLMAQITGLQGQNASGHPRIDKICADLSIQMNTSLTAFDALIAEAETAARQLRSDPSFA